MEGITIKNFETRARLDFDKIKIYLTNDETKKFISILEQLDSAGVEDSTELAVQMAISSFIRKVEYLNSVYICNE